MDLKDGFMPKKKTAKRYRIETPIKNERFSNYCDVKENGSNISFALKIDNNYIELFAVNTGNLKKDFISALGGRYGKIE